MCEKWHNEWKIGWVWTIELFDNFITMILILVRQRIWDLGLQTWSIVTVSRESMLLVYWDLK